MINPDATTIPITISNLSKVKISNNWLNSVRMTNRMPTSMIRASTDENRPRNAALTRNGPLMKERVAPTSFIVCTVNLFAYTVSRIVLLISTKDINIINAMKIPNTADILLRFAFSASTRDC